jgi:hypothetical protein
MTTARTRREGLVKGNDPNDNRQSFQDDALREEVAPKAPSSSDHHGQGFHPESTPERRKEWRKNDAFKKVCGN